MQTDQIRMKGEIVPWTESPTSDARPRDDGSVQIPIAEADAIKMDACERARLQTAYPPLRDTLSKHLREMAKKKPVST